MYIDYSEYKERGRQVFFSRTRAHAHFREKQTGNEGKRARERERERERPYAVTSVGVVSCREFRPFRELQ